MQSRIKRAGRAVTSVIDGVGSLGLIGATVALIGIIAAYLIEVFFRYLLNDPTGWANDMVSYLLAVSVFLAMPKVAQEGGHVAISFLVDALPARFARPLAITLGLIAGLVCLGVAIAIGTESYRQFERGLTTMARYPIPKWWISIVIAFGFLGSGWYFLVQALGPSGRQAASRE